MVSAALAWLALTGVHAGAQATVSSTTSSTTPSTTPSFDDLVAAADTVFLGRVVDSRPFWDEGSWGRAIVTRVVIAVDRVYKGSPATQVSLEFLGGTLDGLTLSVDALPTFRPGDRDVLFVSSAARQVNPIVGSTVGRVRVVRDDRGLETVAAFDGTRISTTAQILQPRAAAATTQAMSLQELERQIALSLRGSR
jgi:hypothetical protein